MHSYYAFLLLNPSLVRAGNAHILAIFGDGAASDLDFLRLQNLRVLLICLRPRWIFFLNELLDAAFQNQQRSVAALRPIHALTEEVTQFENALRRVCVLVGN